MCAKYGNKTHVLGTEKKVKVYSHRKSWASVSKKTRFIHLANLEDGDK